MVIQVFNVYISQFPNCARSRSLRKSMIFFWIAAKSDISHREDAKVAKSIYIDYSTFKHVYSRPISLYRLCCFPVPFPLVPSVSSLNIFSSARFPRMLY
jgi:hypothetical protein